MKEYIDAASKDDPRVSDTEQIGIAGFYADVKMNESEEFTQDAPTTPLEDGSFANDHLIKKPVIITIEGNVSSVQAGGHIQPDTAKRARKTMTLTGAYPSNLTARQKELNYHRGKKTTDTKSLYGLAPAEGSPQNKFVDHIERIYRSGVLIQVETPYRIMDNMAIISFSTRKTSLDDSVSYTIRLQQLEFVTLKTVALKKYKGKATGSGTGSATDEGDQSGSKVKDQSVWSAIVDVFK